MGIKNMPTKLTPEAAAQVIKTKIICSTISKTVSLATMGIIFASVMWGYGARCLKRVAIAETNSRGGIRSDV